ncbi:MAG: hypothetical protein ABI355_19715 [Solirubrobacteraceae bacterium]
MRPGFSAQSSVVLLLARSVIVAGPGTPQASARTPGHVSRHSSARLPPRAGRVQLVVLGA